MNENKPLVSIIATFYNLEDHAKKCVDSMFAQTYGNVEIVLVDDGSVDRTADILNEYGNNSNVSVIHTENHGPGSARNTGLTAAHGDWIMYVDGDDYLYPWSVELLMQCVLVAGTPLAVGSYDIIVDDHENSRNLRPENVCTKVLDNPSAIRALLLEEVTESPCAKVIRADIAAKHPFPEGCWYEDVMWAPRLYLACNAMSVIDIPVYAYVMRSGSVVHRNHAQIKQAQDFLYAIDTMTKTLVGAYPDLCGLIAYRRALELSRLHALLKTMGDDPRAAEMDALCLQEIKSLVDDFKGRTTIPIAKRKRIELIAKAPSLHDLALRVYDKFIKGRGRMRS